MIKKTGADLVAGMSASIKQIEQEGERPLRQIRTIAVLQVMRQSLDTLAGRYQSGPSIAAMVLSEGQREAGLPEGIKITPKQRETLLLQLDTLRSLATKFGKIQREQGVHSYFNFMHVRSLIDGRKDALAAAANAGAPDSKADTKRA